MSHICLVSWRSIKDLNRDVLRAVEWAELNCDVLSVVEWAEGTGFEPVRTCAQ